jgi:hypothetical protein
MRWTPERGAVARASQGAASLFAMHRASRTTGEIAEYALVIH